MANGNNNKIIVMIINFIFGGSLLGLIIWTSSISVTSGKSLQSIKHNCDDIKDLRTTQVEQNKALDTRTRNIETTLARIETLLQRE